MFFFHAIVSSTLGDSGFNWCEQFIAVVSIPLAIFLCYHRDHRAFVVTLKPIFNIFTNTFSKKLR